MENIYVLLPVEQRHKEKLRAVAPGQRIVYVPEKELTAEQAREADMILGNPRPELIASSPRLKLLQLRSAGADPYLKPGVLAEGTLLCNATGAYSKTVSEHALAMTLMLTKKLHLYRDAQKRAEWSDFGTVTSLTDATVLVVGLGDIGTSYAGLVKALGAYVIGVKRRPGEKPDCVDELYTTDRLDEVLPRADVIFSILPGSAANYHVYTAERFAAMKKTAVFLNCGRGGAVAPEVLYAALTEGQIAAAGIDVCEPEPLPADSPLWGLDNLLITPHVAGEYHLAETFERIVDIAAHNVAACLRGEPPRNIVDFATGYKK